MSGLLVHIHQKEKIALEIETKVASVNVPLDKYSLTSFNCSCVRTKFGNFSLIRSLVQKLVMPVRHGVYLRAAIVHIKIRFRSHIS